MARVAASSDVESDSTSTAINPPTVVVMQNSAKDTMDGVRDAMENVAKEAEDLGTKVSMEQLP